MTEPRPGVPVPPDNLLQEWRAEYMCDPDAGSWAGSSTIHGATRGAEWGADEQLRLCVEWLERKQSSPILAGLMYSAMRPEPPKPLQGTGDAAMTTQPPDFRALCTEVLNYRRGEGVYNFSQLSGQERDNAAYDAWHELEYRISAALNTPPLAPIPVSERLPGPEDCDDQGRCWVYDGKHTIGTIYTADWVYRDGPRYDLSEDYFWRNATHWLPHWAIPLPEVQE